MKTIDLHGECEGCGLVMCLPIIFVSDLPKEGWRGIECPKCGNQEEKYFRYLGNEVVYEW